MSRALKNSLTQKLGDRASFGEPMRRHTTWRVGGPAWCYVRVHSVEEAVFVLARAGESGKPVKALGRGSNLLVSDRGYDGVMLRLAGPLCGIEDGADGLRIGGGASLSAAVKRASGLGLSGLEWAVGIPASVGGALATNAGALNRDMAQVAKSVTLLHGDGSSRKYPASELPAGYRRRELPPGSIVLQTELALKPVAPEKVQKSTRANLDKRRASQPLERRTCGSVFKNPAGDYAARLIEQAGLKGRRVGGAMVSPKHANFIENRDQATARDILDLMQRIADEVQKRFGVVLEPEVELVGHV